MIKQVWEEGQSSASSGGASSGGTSPGSASSGGSSAHHTFTVPVGQVCPRLTATPQILP